MLSLAGNVMVAGMGICIYSILAHNLSTRADFGNWVFFVITLSLADIFRTGFLQNSLIKFYAGADLKRSLNVAGSAWYIGFFITMLVCVINLFFYLFFKDAGNPGIYTIINWFGITFFCMLPLSVALWILQAEERFGIILYIRVINQGVGFVAVLLLVAFHQLTLLTAVYANLLAAVIASLVAIVLGWAKLKTLRFRSRKTITELFHYGKYSVATSLAANLLRSSDIYIIKIMLGSASAAAVGVYNMPQKLMEVFEIPLRSFTATVMPKISAAANQGDDKQVARVMKKFISMLFLALLPICIVGLIGADLIINIIGGKKFTGTESALIFRIFISYAMLLPVDRFLGITFDMINKPRINMIKVFIMLAVNIIADIAGLLIFKNIYGVALASILTFFTGTIYGYWTLKKYLKFTMLDIFTVGYIEWKAFINKTLKKQKSNTGE